MAYKRTVWKDRVVERPRTYNQVTNADGSVTQTNAPGEVIEPGTPQNATHFNNMEAGISSVTVAFLLMYTLDQMVERDAASRLEAVEAALAALA